MELWEIKEDANVGGTSLQGFVTASYAGLVRLFGEPLGSDSYKVSGQWAFKGPGDQVVTVYDWKETRLYDKELESVELFRRRASHDWHIGARSINSMMGFKTWLVGKLADEG